MNRITIRGTVVALLVTVLLSSGAASAQRCADCYEEPCGTGGYGPHCGE